MKLSLGFSTCPNDTFIFDALVNGKVDTEGLEFDTFLGDVEYLNNLAFKREIDITKLSYHAYAWVSDKYLLLRSGSALGHNNGPLLVSKRKIYSDEVDDISIAIPGKYTTANLLFSIAWPKATNKAEYLFSDIEELILDNEVDAGLLIHENRFTYKKRGLKKIADMGEYWESNFAKPIPLGGIAISRDLPSEVAAAVNRSLRRSIDFAFSNPESSYPYVRQYAVSMEKDVMLNHINLYVNEFTRDLGKDGIDAVNVLYKEAAERGVIPEIRDDIFIAL